MSDTTDLTKAVKQLVEQAKGIRIEMEAGRVNANSSSDFLRNAIEDLSRAVDRLEAALQ